ncbi:uncharacterized protein BJ212DRAFT_1302338 [Suillus subaureus]|uniref:Uncharacterized protein n=1 Tax=Suillus subaureus TaxID=48587 RepID=A0A9P7E4M2_9AGAM|nr:uncharacterized protein BJ212DRAFT_1302338 [Suillus subaureus]KAG1810597.1 hypothetical protein BJ212DRAFT_1302338 [Suillus subaureus]
MRIWLTVGVPPFLFLLMVLGLVSLAVLRGKCSQCPDLLTYVNNIINEAVNDCKGVRPTHGGELIQFGWNAGPHHAHVFGLVNNLTNKRLLMAASLPAETLGIPWTYLMVLSAFQQLSRLPLRDTCLKTTNHNPIHTDQLYAPYAMNWVTLHSIMDPDQCQLHGDCSSGGNYVDVSLRVVVKCATDTVMSMQPKFKHGTTLTQEGVCRQGTAINFLRHIKKAFNEAIAIEGDVKAMVTQLVEEKK